MATTSSADASARLLLRHTLATLAYRAAKAIRDVPPGFAGFRASQSSRTAGEILAHMADLMDWARSLAGGQHVWREVASQGWEADAARFHASLEQLDAMLASDAPVKRPEKLFQGPIADALCHTGQIAILRRLAGAPVRAENYAKADIEVGVVGAEQPASRAEFG
jgi:hypothetical protein